MNLNKKTRKEIKKTFCPCLMLAPKYDRRDRDRNRDRDRDYDRDKDVIREKDERSNKKTALIGGAAATLLSVLTEAAAHL